MQDAESIFAARRKRMVDHQLAARDIDEPAVLGAMERVLRHRFVSADFVEQAYEDYPLSIGHGQTISQPYIVALMTQLVRPRPGCRALDVGTGSGYQAAVLAELGCTVESVEILAPLAESAAVRLAELGYKNVTVHCADGSVGWSAGAPYDIIIAAAAPDRVPPALIEQLARGGRLAIPIGSSDQELIVYEKRPDGSVTERWWGGVRFVPMIGDSSSPPKG